MNLTFPSEVRTLIDVLRRRRIDHRNYRLARDKLFTMVSLAEPGTVVIFVGPSRSGKSLIGDAVCKELTRSANDDFCPTVWIEAHLTDRGYFSTKHVALQLLSRVRHPMYSMSADGGIDSFRYVPRIGATEPVLWMAADLALKARQTRFVFIDEFHHVVGTRSAAQATGYLDSLKSFGNTTKVVSVWIGGYHLLGGGFASAHLNGRINIVHLQRYRLVPEDIDEFCSVIATLEEMLPLRRSRALLDMWKGLWRGSLGSVGNLMNWTCAAIVQMAHLRDRFLKAEHFVESRFELQLHQVEEDILRGEKLLQNIDLDVAKPVRSEAEVIAKPKTIARKRKPFERTPRRERVGGDS